MKFTLVRSFIQKNMCIGQLYANDAFICYILEDTVRDLNMDGDLDDDGEGKVYAESAIPYGTYEIIVSYSPRFKKDLPLLLNVKGFTGIRIHPGNTISDTAGCLIPGKKLGSDRVDSSTEAFNEIFSLIKHALKSNQIVSITITDKI